MQEHQTGGVESLGIGCCHAEVYVAMPDDDDDDTNTENNKFVKKKQGIKVHHNHTSLFQILYFIVYYPCPVNTCRVRTVTNSHAGIQK